MIHILVSIYFILHILPHWKTVHFKKEIKTQHRSTKNAQKTLLKKDCKPGERVCVCGVIREKKRVEIFLRRKDNEK